MVYGLVYLVVRRNIKFSTKQFLHAESILQRRFPVQFRPSIYYSTDDKSEESKKAEVKPTPSFSDGRSHIDHIIEQAKKGKISVSDITSLAQRVISEAPYKNYAQAPQTVQYIGLAGLAPMLGIPVITLLSGHASSCLAFAHLAFGATVLSFLGGSNWNEAISKNELSYRNLGWAVAPQVIGWMSLLPPLPLGMLFISCGFCLSLVHDVLLSSYPPWMKSLRLVLTAGTVLSYFLMLIFYTIFRRSWSSRSRSDSRSRSASSSKKRTPSGSNSSKSHSRSRSTSRDKSKSLRRSESSSSRSATSPKRLESPPKVPVPRYYGRNRKDSSSSLSLDSSDTDSKPNSGQPSSSNSSRNNVKRNVLDDYSSGGRSAGNARPTSKQTHKERPQEKLKKKMQALLNKQFRADKKAEKERMEKAEQERQDREAELRDIAIKIRRRERYLRHRGEDEENDGEREALRRRERYLRRSEEEDGKRGDKREDSKAESSESGKSKSRSPDSKTRRSRSPKRSSRRSRSPSPKTTRPPKRTLVDY